jgi:hypothetical protein
MSSWVQELFAEIAMDSADVLADIMRLIAQLDNMRTLSQAYPAAATTATAAQADLLKEQFRSGPGFTGVGEVVWSDAVNAARRQFDWAQRQADILANGVRETHTASIKTIDRILAELQQLASRPIPERVPWPTPPELRSGS